MQKRGGTPLRKRALVRCVRCEENEGSDEMSNKKILSENAECLLEFELAPVLCTQPCPLAVRGGRRCLIFTAAPPPVALHATLSACCARRAAVPDFCVLI